METPPSVFAKLGFNKYILDALSDCGISEPTEIQLKSLPSSISGQDILGIAQTGTGKTAAYILPILYHLKYNQPPFPRAVILVPARELAIQVLQHFNSLACYTSLKAVALFGGLGPKAQKELLQQGADVIIATPGRLLELYHTGDVVFKKVKHLVIDEADRMMDLGFMPQIRKLLEVLPVKRQNMLFSATFPEKVSKLSEEFLEFPVRVEVTPQSTVKSTLDHALYMVPNFRTRLELCMHLLSKLNKDEAAIVFVRTKGRAKEVSQFIAENSSLTVRALHGNIGQNTRIHVIEGVRAGQIQVLVATDVAARGHDIRQVELVINFDVPLRYEDYVHRVGRTGRMMNTGLAYTFAHEADMYHIRNIEKLIKQPIPVLPIPENVTVFETPFDEKQQILKQLDLQKKKLDPNYQGAFHEKKKNKHPGEKHGKYGRKQ